MKKKTYRPAVYNKIFVTLFVLVVSIQMLNAQTDALIIDENGNVGIRTSNPSALLDVSGKIQAKELSINSNSGNVPLQVTANDATLLRITNNGYVGIGTSSPTALLHVSGSETTPNGFSSAITLTNTAQGGQNWYLRSGAQGTATPSGGFTIANNNAYIMTFTQNQHVGIGTLNPGAPLHVSGFSSTYITSPGSNGYGYLNWQETNTGPSGLTANFSILADHRVRASEFDAVSDKRIKEVISQSSSEEDLLTILAMKVTNYQYVDKVSKGDDTKTGLIAQQVEEVFPQAVNRSTDFIPDIYALAKNLKVDKERKELTVILDKAHELVAGDLVRLISDQGEVQKRVFSIQDEKTFTLNDWTEKTEQLFVYGKQVNDFRSVDYDQVAMLGISAIQQLHKEIALLKEANEELRSGLLVSNQLLEEVNHIKSQLAELQKKVIPDTTASR